MSAKTTIIADLAFAAARDALEAIHRKAALGLDGQERGAIMSAAYAIVEARCRFARSLVGDQHQGRLVDQLAGLLKDSAGEDLGRQLAEQQLKRGLR